jgi:hypothetical protein
MYPGRHAILDHADALATMTTTLVLIGILTIACVVAYLRSRIPGYRGSLGFKNQSTSDLDYIQLTGFSRTLECRSLAPSEHSFSYRGRQNIPPTATVTWRLAGSTAIQTAAVSLADVPTTLSDGEIFFVFRSPSTWTVEYADHLQLGRLQNGK